MYGHGGNGPVAYSLDYDMFCRGYGMGGSYAGAARGLDCFPLAVKSPGYLFSSFFFRLVFWTMSGDAR